MSSSGKKGSGRSGRKASPGKSKKSVRSRPGSRLHLENAILGLVVAVVLFLVIFLADFGRVGELLRKWKLSKPEEITPPVVTKPSPSPSSSKKKERRVEIFYAEIEENGTVSLRGVPKTIPNSSTTPLTGAILTLLQGPSPSESAEGLVSLIPQESVLLSAKVVDGTAFLNFKESFRFNPLGLEGHVAQLQQIVYTATSFPSVSRVQILIEGSIVDYLGGEGVFVRDPLDRNSF